MGLHRLLTTGRRRRSLMPATMCASVITTLTATRSSCADVSANDAPRTHGPPGERAALGPPFLVDGARPNGRWQFPAVAASEQPAGDARHDGFERNEPGQMGARRAWRR